MLGQEQWEKTEGGVKIVEMWDTKGGWGNAEVRCTQEVELPRLEAGLSRRDGEGGVNLPDTIHRDAKQMGRNRLKGDGKIADWTVLSHCESAVLEDT